MKIFWSWQSDIDGKISRHFIKDCLTESIEEIGNEILLDERLEIDHDTKGVLGSPSITDTILQKITESNLFIGDVTPIALAENGKKVMNPNVAIEMGYAISEKGDTNIITIMNTAFGKLPDDLPFDLRHKRGAITYFLKNQASKEQILDEKKKLIKIFKEVIKGYLSINPIKDLENAFNFDLNGPGVFFDLEKPLLRMSKDGWSVVQDKEIMVKMENSYLYVKVIPKIELSFSKTDLTRAMIDNSNFKIYPMFNNPDNTPVTNKYGSIVFKFDAENKDYINDFTQLFKNGAIIGVTNSYLYYSRNILYLIDFKNKLEKFLEKAVNLAKNLNQSADFDISIEIGFVNKDNCKIVIPNPDGNKRYIANERGPLEEECYILKKNMNTKDTGKIEMIIKEFILSLTNDLGLEFDYEHHNWN